MGGRGKFKMGGVKCKIFWGYLRHLRLGGVITPLPPPHSRIFGHFLNFLNFELNVPKASITIQKLLYNIFFDILQN